MSIANTNILVVEDEAIIAEDLSSILSENGFNIIGVAHTGEQALDMLHNRDPNFVLLDIRLGSSLTGLDVAKSIHENYGIPFIFLTSFDDDKTLDAAKQYEPMGYIVKPFHERTLLTTIKMTLSNFQKTKTNQTDNISKLLANSNQKVTEQENAIISFLISGKSYKEIAAEKFISINTVRFHVKNIYTKFQVSGRSELVAALLG